jgi:hypothetical protein
MGNEELALEALKLSRDWATWLASIAVAVIGGMFALLTAKERIFSRVEVTVQHKQDANRFDGRYLMLLGLLCLAASVGWASIGLVGMPEVGILIASNASGSIFSKTVPFPFPSPLSLNVPLWVPLYMQNITFALGMFLIVVYLWLAYVGTILNSKDS